MSSDLRLTPTSYIVLGLLEAAGEATPYDLKRAVGQGLGNFWSLPHAQLYAEPERLAAAGLLDERQEPSGRRRKHYKLTERGREALREWLAQPTEEMTELRDLAMLKVFFGAEPERMAAAQLPVHASKLAEYETLLADAGRQLPRGIVLSLEAGIGHERDWVEFWSRLAPQADEAD
jgi:PadR family transcriptional regulator AphA